MTEPRPAGLIPRLAAMLYDTVLLTGLWFVATAVLLAFRGGNAFRPHDMGYTLFLLLLAFAFFGWFWTHGGQTLGMRAWRIRVSREEGGDVTWNQAAVRFLVALLSLATLGLGYWWALLDARRRAWHDRAAGTCVYRVTTR